MTSLQALLLGLVQGLTEYLPVSSSGHLAAISNYFGVDGESNLMFTIAVHVATVLSTFVVLWKEIVWLLKGLFRPLNQGNGSFLERCNYEQRYALAIIVSMIPVGIVGVFFKDAVEEVFGQGLTVVGICLIITALLLAASSYLGQHAYPSSDSNLKSQPIPLGKAFVVGLAQAVAVLPGISRSGSTIATGLMLGIDKARMAQFSFLMVIPPILGEALLEVVKGLKDGSEAVAGNELSMGALVIGFVAAFISGCAACKWMIGIVKKGKLIYFAGYCALAGVLLLIFA